MRARKVFLALVYLSSGPCPVLAHHSAAMFDVTQERVVQGVVTDFAWKNPHSYLTIRTSGENPVDQVIEVGPPATLRPLGLTEDAVRVGDAVSVRVNPAKRGNIVLGRELTKTDGSIWPLLLDPFSRRPEPVQAASSIEGTWVSQGFFSMCARHIRLAVHGEGTRARRFAGPSPDVAHSVHSGDSADADALSRHEPD